MIRVARASHFVLFAGLVLVSACTKEPATLTAAAPDGAVAAVDGPRWHFGSRHYRERGRRPVRFTLGMAGINAEALVGSDGRTTLVLTSFRAGNPDQPAGDIQRVLLKIIDHRGRLVSLRLLDDHRRGSTFTETIRGVAPGFTLELWASVGGLDRKRVDIVHVREISIGRRPDLAITGLSVPSVLVAGSQTIIAATVAELGGDHGATADCKLSVDGIVVDRARGIWVDAGDAVSCAFTTVFTVAGPHRVVVRLDNIAPNDDDASNNAAEEQVSVVVPGNVGGPGTDVTFTAAVRSGTFTTLDSFSTIWTLPSSGLVFLEARNHNSATGSDQSAMISGVIGTRLAFPLSRIELRQSSAGALIHTALYTDVPPDNAGNADCVARGVGTGTEFYLCSDPIGFTSVTYRRATGTVTYVSDQYQRVWNGSSYDETAWVDNGTTVTTGPVVPFAGSFAFDVRITDPTGTWVVSELVPLAALTENDVTPRACSTSNVQVPPNTYVANTCTFSSYVFTGVAGSASGQGAITAQSGVRSIP